MRIQLWNFLYYVKYNLIFAGMYRRKINTWHAWVRGVPIVLTFICITGWGLVPGVPWLWGILIAMAQLVTLVAEQIPVFLHPPALSYFISEVSSFMVDAENQWDCYSDDDDEKIKNVLPQKRQFDRALQRVDLRPRLGIQRELVRFVKPNQAQKRSHILLQRAQI